MNKMTINYWSKTPGKFVVRNTGEDYKYGAEKTIPFFNGPHSMWYQSLRETINLVKAEFGNSDRLSTSLSDDIILTKEVLDNIKSIEIFKNNTKIAEVVILD